MTKSGNDGSKDDGATEKVALSYGDRIKYLSKPNGGVSSALNYGIEHMSGDYFSWLSHDDLYEPDKIEQEVVALASQENPNNTIICCADSLIDVDGKPIYHPTKQLTGLYPGSRLFDIFFSQHLIINGCTLLIPKDAFKRFGGFSSFKYIKDKLVKMRVHTGQVTQRMPELFYTEMRQFSNDIIDNYLTEGKLSSLNIEAFLIYHYKKHNKDIYVKIEKNVGNIMPVKKYMYQLYGYCFSLLSFIYSKTIKR